MGAAAVAELPLTVGALGLPRVPPAGSTRGTGRVSCLFPVLEHRGLGSLYRIFMC